MGYSAEEVNTILNKKSGALGVSGISSDFRDVKDAAYNKGDKRAKIALDIFSYRVRKTIGAYAAAMNGVDAVVFTAGVGENSDITRKECLENMEFIGIEFDEERNKVNGEIAKISKDTSKVAVYVIPTNEELMIAKETVDLLN